MRTRIVTRIDAPVAQGTMIKGVLETAIQSDLPGQVRAVVSEDVWSFDGRRVLIIRAMIIPAIIAARKMGEQV